MRQEGHRLNDHMKHILNKAAASVPEKVSGRPLVYKQTPPVQVLSVPARSPLFRRFSHWATQVLLAAATCPLLSSPACGRRCNAHSRLSVCQKPAGPDPPTEHSNSHDDQNTAGEMRAESHTSATSLIKDWGFHFPHIGETRDSRLGYMVTNVQGHTHFLSKNTKLAKRIIFLWPEESVIEELGFQKIRIFTWFSYFFPS